MWFNFPKSKYIKKAFSDYYTQDMISQTIDIMTRIYPVCLVNKPNESKKHNKKKQ